MGKPTISWSPESLAVWAKTGDVDAGDWLNLPRHMMDSAAVAEYLWDEWVPEGIRHFIAGSLGLPQGRAKQLFAFVAGVHDLGKSDPTFSTQLLDRPGYGNYMDRLVDAGFTLKSPERREDRYPHSVGSFGALKRELTIALEESGVEARDTAAMIRGLAELVGAHHGLPVSEGLERRMDAFASSVGEQWATVQAEACRNMAAWTGFTVPDGLPTARRQPSRPVQMLLTALIIMADWIASNQFLFPLSPRPETSSETRRDRAVSRLGLPRYAPRKPFAEDITKGFQDRFGWPEGRTPFNAQRAMVETAQRIDGPMLITLEASTGSGKTEAALAAAETLAAKTGRSGVMVAAPTMATSDALLRRVKDWAASYAGKDVSSLYLGHSKNFLNEDMMELRDKADAYSSIGIDEGDRESMFSATDNVIAHEWLSGRKKGILSDFVVGTVDQVLFMGLQSKHAMLRHLGLANKVVIIDEVHAYDAYMSAYLGRVLQWLGAYHTPVILLSATLPHETKAQLVANYAQGLTGRRVRATSVDESGDKYPVLTVAHRDGIDVIPVDAEARPSKSVEFRSLGESEDHLESVMDQVVEHGGNLLVLCNTVTRAQRAYALAQAKVGDEATLLHARFVAAHRVSKEAELVDRLGPKKDLTTGRPRASIVVATQVVEQSLDVDFDAMVTDIAPIDLLIQRVGRVHRHNRPQAERPTWARELTIYLRGIEREGDDTQPPEFERTQEAIYERALLLNTWAAIRHRTSSRDGSLHLPDEIPQLIKGVYGETNMGPESWQEDYDKAYHELETARHDAQQKASSYMFHEPTAARTMRDLWSASTQDVDKNVRSEAQGLAQVRDTDPTLEVCVTRRVHDDVYEPFPSTDPGNEYVYFGHVPDPGIALEIAARSVRLPYVFSRPNVFEKALTELETTTDIAWKDSPTLRGQLQLILDDENRVEIAGRHLRYDYDLGLIDETSDKRKAEEHGH